MIQLSLNRIQPTLTLNNKNKFKMNEEPCCQESGNKNNCCAQEVDYGGPVREGMFSGSLTKWINKY
jgi:hypothetical protein